MKNKMKNVVRKVDVIFVEERTVVFTKKEFEVLKMAKDVLKRKGLFIHVGSLRVKE